MSISTNVGLAVEDACAASVAFMLEQLPSLAWTGTVVTVREVDILRDPDTGEVLDESMIEVARLKVSQVKEKLSIAEVTSGDAAAVLKGMTIHR